MSNSETVREQAEKSIYEYLSRYSRMVTPDELCSELAGVARTLSVRLQVGGLLSEGGETY